MLLLICQPCLVLCSWKERLWGQLAPPTACMALKGGYPLLFPSLWPAAWFCLRAERVDSSKGDERVQNWHWTALALHCTGSAELTYHTIKHSVGNVMLNRTALPLLQVHTLPFLTRTKYFTPGVAKDSVPYTAQKPCASTEQFMCLVLILFLF